MTINGPITRSDRVATASLEVQDDDWRRNGSCAFQRQQPRAEALLGKQMEVSIASLSSSIEFIRSGKLRGLAVTSTKRVEALPDVPAVVESVLGHEVSAWYGVGAPKGTPNELIDKLNNEINASLADPKLKAPIADFVGGTGFALSPAGFSKFIRRRNREVGQGDPGGQHQASVNPPH